MRATFALSFVLVACAGKQHASGSVALGGSVVLCKRRPGLSAPLWWATWGAFLLATFLAIAKPF